MSRRLLNSIRERMQDDLFNNRDLMRWFRRLDEVCGTGNVDQAVEAYKLRIDVMRAISARFPGDSMPLAAVKDFKQDGMDWEHVQKLTDAHSYGNPILIEADGTLVDGRHRVTAARGNGVPRLSAITMRGWKQLPIW